MLRALIKIPIGSEQDYDQIVLCDSTLIEWIYIFGLLYILGYMCVCISNMA